MHRIYVTLYDIACDWKKLARAKTGTAKDQAYIAMARACPCACVYGMHLVSGRIAGQGLWGVHWVPIHVVLRESSRIAVVPHCLVNVCGMTVVYCECMCYDVCLTVCAMIVSLVNGVWQGYKKT
jgi:hypothetical protein